MNLIFDFDGTLVDSFCAAMAKFNLLADQFNFRKIDQTEQDGLRNLTSRELIKHLQIPLLKLPSVLKLAREALRDEARYLPTFSEIPEVLTELHQQGCCMSILTSNSAENVVSWLEQYKIQHLFNFIHAESSYFGKQKLLKKIIKANKMNAFETFYIGDETRDVEAAQKSKINSIAVSWGFNSEEILMRCRPNYFAKTPRDLLRIINGFRHPERSEGSPDLSIEPASGDPSLRSG